MKKRWAHLVETPFDMPAVLVFGKQDEFYGYSREGFGTGKVMEHCFKDPLILEHDQGHMFPTQEPYASRIYKRCAEEIWKWCGLGPPAPKVSRWVNFVPGLWNLWWIFREISCGHLSWKLKDEHWRTFSPDLSPMSAKIARTSLSGLLRIMWRDEESAQRGSSGPALRGLGQESVDVQDARGVQRRRDWSEKPRADSLFASLGAASSRPVWIWLVSASLDPSQVHSV